MKQCEKNVVFTFCGFFRLQQKYCDLKGDVNKNLENKIIHFQDVLKIKKWCTSSLWKKKSLKKY
ncbi:hypothetical protein BpHYR1_000721 [Brachionus plicatilis]|uniref:Uncharacterized protein n=1 Tax=Brachionus plicatilis TaxID=10195 RepID=A0A3M7SBW2_BRAPC|nr:hypothetical protein BpHYR1_000721 [Brachionus plicatilis]